MSASPEHQATVSAASPDLEVPRKSHPPITGDDDVDAKPAEPAAEFEDNAEDAAEQGGDDEDDDEKLSDDESILSEVDEAQFDELRPQRTWTLKPAHSLLSTRIT